HEARLNHSLHSLFIGAEMHIDPALLSATSALVGALIGDGASLAAAMYTQRYQDRLQRVARENEALCSAGCPRRSRGENQRAYQAFPKPRQELWKPRTKGV